MKPPNGDSFYLGPHAGDNLSSQHWEFLLDRTILYAAGHINRLRWRGAVGGVLPDGFDPASIAAQAITDFLEPPTQKTASASRNLTLAQTQRELERLVRKQVNRLHHRKENLLLRDSIGKHWQ